MAKEKLKTLNIKRTSIIDLSGARLEFDFVHIAYLEVSGWQSNSSDVISSNPF